MSEEYSDTLTRLLDQLEDTERWQMHSPAFFYQIILIIIFILRQYIDSSDIRQGDY